MTEPIRFCLVSYTDLVAPAELFSLSKALEVNARHCAQAWGLPAPTVDVISTEGKLPRWGAALLFVDDSTQHPDALAVHWWNSLRGMPAGRVYCDRSSGLMTGRYSISEAASHEVVEALVDPRVDQWADMPGRPGVQVAVEVGDPVQTHYVIESDGRPWRVSNFVTPDWFRLDLVGDEDARDFLAAGGRFDYSGELKHPGEVTGEGYVILREWDGAKWRYWDETRGAHARSWPTMQAELRAARYPMARSERRRRGHSGPGIPRA